jgi:ubiquinone/menaquinone biosynthesis C-methylase UbiE
MRTTMQGHADFKGHRCHAALYDLLVSSDKTMNRLRAEVVGSASGSVLEVGCGTGLNFAYVNWMDVESYVATEPDAFMLQKAREKASELPPEAQARLRLEEAPAESVPATDASVDVVIATLVFCTVQDMAQALAEAKRVLRPGGQLRLVEHVAGTGARGTMQRIVQPVYGWMAADCHLRRDTEAAVKAAGFELEVTERFSLGPIWPAFVGIATKPADER